MIIIWFRILYHRKIMEKSSSTLCTPHEIHICQLSPTRSRTIFYYDEFCNFSCKYVSLCNIKCLNWMNRTSHLALTPTDTSWYSRRTQQHVNQLRQYLLIYVSTWTNELNTKAPNGSPTRLTDVTFTDKAGGLLIVTPTKSDLDEHNDQHTNVAVSGTSDLTKLEESFGGPAKGSAITNLFNSVPKGSIGFKDQTVVGQDNNVESYPPAQQPDPTYGAPDHANYNNPAQNYNIPIQNYEQNYVQDNAYQQPELPQITLHHHIPNLGDPNLSVQPSVEYPPLHVQQYQYPNPLVNSPKLPHEDGGTSVYTSLSIDTEPQISSFKRPLLNHPSALDLPKLQPHVNFHRHPQLANDLHGSLGGPLRISLLKPMPTAYYWHGEGAVVPTSPLGTLDHFHKRNVLHRRTLAKRFARHSLLQRMRFHQ